MGQQDHFPRAGLTDVAARGRNLTSRIRHWYGAHPLHLLALLAAFALAGYAVRAVIATGQFRGFAIWFAVAIVGHDLLLFPLYSLADLSVQRLLPRGAARRRARRPAATASGTATAPGTVPDSGTVPGPPVINYVRIPVAFSLLLLLVFFPLILGLSQPEYHRASGLATQPYLWRWIAVTGVLFAGSAVLYALRCRRASSRARKQAARTCQQVPGTGDQAPPTRPAPPVPSVEDIPSSAPRPGFDVWHPVRHSPDPHGPP
jgi:hypothetical protein